MALSEADTCRKLVVPRLQAPGWDTPPHAINEQLTVGVSASTKHAVDHCRAFLGTRHSESLQRSP